MSFLLEQKIKKLRPWLQLEKTSTQKVVQKECLPQTCNRPRTSRKEHITNLMLLFIVLHLQHFFQLHCRCLHRDEALLYQTDANQ